LLRPNLGPNLGGINTLSSTFGEGANSDLPWASVFDPAANARVLSSIQAEGFRAASELVDRFVRIAATGLNGAERSASSTMGLTDSDRHDLFGATDVEPLIRSWWALIGQFLLGATPHAAEGVAVDSATLDLSNAHANGQLDLLATSPGAAKAEVWLHNRGAGDLGQIRLRCSDLLAHDGGVVSSAAVTFDPATVAMPGRSSRGVDVTIEVPQGVSPGTYRGTVLAQGHPDLWLPIVLTAQTPAP
jgi:hypothetical protein